MANSLVSMMRPLGGDPYGARPGDFDAGGGLPLVDSSGCSAVTPPAIKEPGGLYQKKISAITAMDSDDEDARKRAIEKITEMMRSWEA